MQVPEEPAWTVVVEERREGDPNPRIDEWGSEVDPDRHLADDEIWFELICGLSDGLDYLRTSARS